MSDGTLIGVDIADSISDFFNIDSHYIAPIFKLLLHFSLVISDISPISFLFSSSSTKILFFLDAFFVLDISCTDDGFTYTQCTVISHRYSSEPPHIESFNQLLVSAIIFDPFIVAYSN